MCSWLEIEVGWCGEGGDAEFGEDVGDVGGGGEALIGDGLGCTDWWVIAGKLPIAEFERWTPEQRQLTLTAIKLWIANDEIDLIGTGLDAAAILQMPMKDVVGLYDPYYGTAKSWWGKSRRHEDTITFLLEESAALSESIK